MKNKLIWLWWKLFCPIECPTCIFIGEISEDKRKEYSSFLGEEIYNFDPSYSFNSYYYNQKNDSANLDKVYNKRREMMWRFLVKGER